MAIATYKKIASVTVGSGGQATIEFNNIPQVYDDLVLKISGRSTRSTYRDGFQIRINGSNSNFTYRMLEATGSSPGSYSGSAPFVSNVPAATATSSTFSNSEIYFPNYRSSSNKSYSGDGTQSNNSSTNQTINLNAGLWSNTSIINSISMIVETGNFVQYSTATLYGIVRSN